MKVIIIRDALVSTVVGTYMVNDDVTLPDDTEGRLRASGYTHQVLHPVGVNQASILEEINLLCTDS